jgi:predicted AAA+ superfamily ATPase
MINRTLSNFLHRWKNSPSRLPLILRGARQVGKTTLIHDFSKNYDQYLYFNLERNEDAKLFSNRQSITNLVSLIFLSKNIKNAKDKSTLIFIDEVQEVPYVIEQLRYFYEEFPELHIIVTGSLLDFALQKIERVPVGRVEYAEMHPLSFREYLDACDKTAILDKLDNEMPLSNDYLSLIMVMFNEYAMVGGMPMIVKNYIEEKSLVRLKELYNGISEAYKTDVSKYAKSPNEANIIRQIIDTVPLLVDERINMAKFGALAFKSIDIRNGLIALEQARLLELVYPTSNTSPPIIGDSRKRPRLHYLDVGLLNYQLGLHHEYLIVTDLNHIAKGALIQQIVNQEIKAQNYLNSTSKGFWARDEKGTSSEVDLLYSFRNHLIPIEVKSGATGTLRSLHEFMDRCYHIYAIRIYSGELRIDTVKTRTGKSYKLLNLPYFLSGWIEQYLNWFFTIYTYDDSKKIDQSLPFTK